MRREFRGPQWAVFKVMSLFFATHNGPKKMISGRADTLYKFGFPRRFPLLVRSAFPWQLDTLTYIERNRVLKGVKAFIQGAKTMGKGLGI